MKRSIIWAVLVPAAVIMLGGCRMSYILHAAAGQFRLLNGSVPVEQALEDNALTPAQKKQLSLVAAIKSFGENELGLKKTRNYETVYLHSKPSRIYVVCAAPKDELKLITWWFPVVGSMPYLGFFDLDRAKVQKEKLVQKELDAVIIPAEAYSTLGWFQDPVTLNLIEGSTLSLVETVLHEMTHTTLYVKGQGEFNEGLAVLVGKRGSLLFMEKKYGSTDPLTLEAAKAIHDERLFSSFVATLLADLERLYNSPKTYEEKLAERQSLFEIALRRFEVLESEMETPYFLGFGKHPLDNAYLMSVGLYHRHFHTFERTLDRHGGSIKSMLTFLKEAAKKDGPVLARLEGKD